MFPPRPRRARVLELALPIIGAMVSQNLLNLVETAFVGRLGDASIAAVSTGNFFTFASMAFVTGLSAGVQAMVARRKGEGRESEAAVPLNGGLVMVLGFGIPIAIAMYFLAPIVFPIIAKDPHVADLGTTYYRIRLLSICGIGINFAFRGFWSSVNLPGLYMRTLFAMHIVNVGLDYVLIFGLFGAPRLGIDGAAWGNVIATWLGVAFYVVQGHLRVRSMGFLRGVPSLQTMGTMLRASVPAALQQVLFAAGMLTLFAILYRVGTSAVAASGVLIQLFLVAMLPAMGFGIAAASLVGHALGQKDAELARRWGWDVVRVAVPVVSAIAFIGLVLPDPILGIFLDDPDTLALARWPLRLVAISLPFDAAGMILLNALFGAGDSGRVLAVSTGMQWLFFLPIAFLVGPWLGWGLSAIWAANVVYRGIQSGIFAALWRGDRWTKIKI